MHRIFNLDKLFLSTLVLTYLYSLRETYLPPGLSVPPDVSVKDR